VGANRAGRLPGRLQVGRALGDVVREQQHSSGGGPGLGDQLKSVEVDEVGHHDDAFVGHAVLEGQAVADRLVDGNVAGDVGVQHRLLGPWPPPVAHSHHWHVAVVGKRRHGNQMVLAVDDVRPNTEGGQVVAHRHRGVQEFVGHSAQLGAVHHGPMAPPQQFDGQVADVEL